MDQHFHKIIKQATKAQAIQEVEVIQSLWSGYGEIVRYAVFYSDLNINSVVVKHVHLPKQSKHPRGWNTDLSHERKVHSYQIETYFYEHYNAQCSIACYTPQCFAIEHRDDEILMVMEDLDDSAYSERRTAVDLEEMKVCLNWLANFHATYMQQSPVGLWQSGTYWHLQTRPEELKALQDIPLKKAANSIDQILRGAKYQSFVHGDAKLANFCFGRTKEGEVKVAAVDFQYVGGGCGMKDVAYFIGSCLYEEDCDRYESTLLDYYLEALQQALGRMQPAMNAIEIVKEWRELYHWAWADFHRFLKGWSPEHWKINSYSERICKEVIDKLGKQIANGI